MIGLAGFDRTVVRALEAEHAAWIYGLAAAGLVGVVLVATAGAYELGLLFERRVGYALGMLFALLLALNMLRLLNAGLGATAGLPFSVWRPKIVAIVLSWVVAMLLAQPLVTWVLRDEVEAVIAIKRDAVVTLHRGRMLGRFDRESAALDSAMAAIDAELLSVREADNGNLAALRQQRAVLEEQRRTVEARRERAEAVELPAFAASVQQAGFIADRIRAAWQRPLAALGLTVLFATLITLGGILRWPARDAVRAYEAERHRRERAFIEQSYVENRVQRQRQYERYATFERIPEWYEDPPYNTQPKSLVPVATPIEWEALMERLRGRE